MGDEMSTRMKDGDVLSGTPGQYDDCGMTTWSKVEKQWEGREGEKVGCERWREDGLKWGCGFLMQRMEG